MRRMTLDEIRNRIASKRQAVDYSVHIFRGKTKEVGWMMKRTRQRDADEIKALNYLARTTLRNALKDGTVSYDKERRVLVIAKFRSSQKGN